MFDFESIKALVDITAKGELPSHLSCQVLVTLADTRAVEILPHDEPLVRNFGKKTEITAQMATLFSHLGCTSEVCFILLY